MEASYKVVTVKAYRYDDRNGNPIEVNTLCIDAEHAKLYKEQHPEKPYHSTFDISEKAPKPEKNYLDMIKYGAQQLGLDQEYRDKLEEFECIPFVKYQPTEQQLEAINQRLWTMEELEQFKKENT